MDTATDDGDDWPDSGPYCRHWSDEDCEAVCAACGHRCGQHDGGFDGAECLVYGCACEGWKESK